MENFFLNYSDTTFPLLAAILLIVYIRKWQPGAGWLFAYSLISFMLMGYGNLLADRGIHNLYIYHVFTIVESILVLHLINILSPEKYKYINVVLSLFLCFTVLNLIFWEPLFTSFNSNAAGVFNLISTVFCFRYFIQLAKNDNILHFQKLAGFWIVSGFLFYSVVSVLVLSAYKYREMLPESDAALTWTIQQVANMIRFVLIYVGVIWCYRPDSSSGLYLSDRRR